LDSDYSLDGEYISQREIEKDLIEKLDKGSERSLSLLKFVFTVTGFYAVALFYVYDKLDINVIINSAPYPKASTSIQLCFITLFIAFFFSFKPLTVIRYKFIETERSIKYRDGHDLEKNNRRIAINIRKQDIYNMLSTYCISSSFLFFLGYFFGGWWIIGASSFASIALINFIDAWLDVYGIELNGREVKDVDEKYREKYDSDKGIITTIIDILKEIKRRHHKTQREEVK
jgi:hypothetical protein